MSLTLVNRGTVYKFASLFQQSRLKYSQRCW